MATPPQLDIDSTGYPYNPSLYYEPSVNSFDTTTYRGMGCQLSFTDKTGASRISQMIYSEPNTGNRGGVSIYMNATISWISSYIKSNGDPAQVYLTLFPEAYADQTTAGILSIGSAYNITELNFNAEIGDVSKTVSYFSGFGWWDWSGSDYFDSQLYIGSGSTPITFNLTKADSITRYIKKESLLGANPTSAFELFKISSTFPVNPLTAQKLSRNEGTVELGDNSAKTRIKFYDTTSKYPPYRTYISESHEVRANDTSATPRISTTYPLVTWMTTNDSFNQPHKLFMKLNLPNLNGLPIASFLYMNMSSSLDSKRVLMYNIRTTTNVTWDQSSSAATLNAIDSSAVYAHLECSQCFIDTSKNPYCIDVGAGAANDVAKANGSDPDKNINYYIYNDSTQITLILEDATKYADSTNKSTSFQLGKNTVAYPAFGGAYDLKTFDATGINRPQLKVIYIPPKIHLSSTSVSRTTAVTVTPSSQTITVTNTGYGTLNCSLLESPTVGWLSLNKASLSPITTGSDTFIVSFNVTGLTPGVYNTSILVVALDSDTIFETIPVTLTVTSASTIVRSPTSISRTINAGTNASNDTFQVWDGNNTNLDSINYNITDNVAWLSVSPTSGTSDTTSAKNTHTITYSTSSLAVGVHNATITLNDPSLGDTKTIPVSMTVQAASYVVLSTNTINVSTAVGTNATSVTFQVWDGNATALDSISYNITDNVAWLSVSATSGTSTGSTDKKTHTITFATSALSAGDHTATITVNDPTRASTATITVNLTVAGGSYIVVNPVSINKEINTGDSITDEILEIWDGNSPGGDNISFNISDSLTWLSVTPSTGSSTGVSNKSSHTIIYDTSLLGPGLYSGNISIYDPTLDENVNVPVTLNVLSTAYIVSDTTSISLDLQTNEIIDININIWDGSLNALDYIDYTISWENVWLSVNPFVGESYNESDKSLHTVTINSTGLQSGQFNDIIHIEDINGDTLDIPVTITINKTIRNGIAYGYFLM